MFKRIDDSALIDLATAVRDSVHKLVNQALKELPCLKYEI